MSYDEINLVLAGAAIMWVLILCVAAALKPRKPAVRHLTAIEAEAELIQWIEDQNITFIKDSTDQ